MTRRVATVAGALALGLALAAPPAGADEQITAAPPNRYVDNDVAIDQGEKVTFTNNDTVQHDVVSRLKGADGKPLFASELVGTGRTAPVAGTEYLTTGDYAFFCSLHPQMTGTLRVGPNGTPVPRPGGNTPPPPGQPGGGADTTAPALQVTVRDRRLADVARRRALRLAVTVDEAATVRLVLRAGRVRLGTKTVKPGAAGTQKVSVRLTPAGRRLVRRARRVRVSLVATARDAADNAVTLRKKRILRRQGR